MSRNDIFDTIDGLFSFIEEQDDQDGGSESDYDGDGEDFPDKDDGSDSEFIDNFSNRFEMIADRIGGVVSFVKDDDKDAALVSLEKIIEDMIKSYYDMGGEGDALKGIRGKSKDDGKSKGKGKKEKKDSGKKEKEKKDSGKEEKEKDGGDEEKKDQEIGESVYSSAMFNRGKDLSDVDVGYNINESEKELNFSRVLNEGGGDDPFGMGGDFVSDIKRRSGVK